MSECGIRCRSSDKECKALEAYIKERLEFIPRITAHDKKNEANSFEDSLEAGYMKEQKNKLHSARDTLNKPSVISRPPDEISHNNREYVLNPQEMPHNIADDIYSVNKLDNNLEFKKNVEQMNDRDKSDRGSYINSVSYEPQNNLIKSHNKKESILMEEKKKSDEEEW